MKRIQIVITDDENGAMPVLDTGLADTFLRKLIPAQNAGDDQHDRIGSVLLSMGMPAHIKGFAYLREAVKLALEMPACFGAIMKELYPAVAEHFGATPSKVERDIRHAIDVTWRRGHVENINQLLGCRMVSQLDKPSNGELIALIAECLSRAREWPEADAASKLWRLL